MVDFSKMMTKDQMDRWARQDREVERLFELPDRWLARELLSLARAARYIGHDVFGHETPKVDRYQSELVWDIVPEVAARLGETSFHKHERSAFIRGVSDHELRLRAANQVDYQTLLVMFAQRLHRGINVYNLLTRPPVKGNPVFIGLDRFAPADRVAPDWAAKTINANLAARGVDGVFSWCPDPEGHDFGEPTPAGPPADVVKIGMFR
jgi:hypothetical protein